MYDVTWEKLPFELEFADAGDVERPVNLGTMLDYAKRLATNIPFVRVDFYQIGNEVRFGEMTFYPGCGQEKFKPEEYDKILGDWLKLPS